MHITFDRWSILAAIHTMMSGNVYDLQLLFLRQRDMPHGLITLLVIALILIIFGTLLFLNLRAWDHFDQGVREIGDPTGKFGNKHPKTAMVLYGLALIWGAHVLWAAISSGNIEALGSDAHYRESSSPALFWIMFTGWLVFTLVVGGRFLFKVGQLSKKY